MTLRIALIAAALALCPAVAEAQTAAPPAPPPPPRHEATGELAFVGVSGNASTTTFVLGFEAIARPSAWIFRHRVAFVRNESNGTLNAQSFLYTPRAERTINPRLGAFGEYQFFRDRFAGISQRNQVTGGLSAKIADSARHKFAADAGAGYLNEERLAGSNISSAIYTAGTNYRFKLSDTAEFTDDLALVGTFSKAEDWRLSHGMALTAKLTDAVSLKLSNGVRYANFPAFGFKKTDVITSVALVAKFKSNP
jgi:putative salt-induced outer membrane protein YdiY